ncbi:Mitochondrial inner membrane protein oxa1 [Peltigera leucophlebia]|nr:Mitochondrial inner membrane protein oxa1 [Peltigera leucophlebia]
MIPLRSLRWAANIRQLQRVPVAKSFHSLPHLSNRHGCTIDQLKSQPLLLQSRSSSLVATGFLYTQSKRYASTGLPTPTNFDPSPVPIAPSPSLSSSLESIIENDYSLPLEHIGYLKDLGLYYGWGPTAFIQTLLEHVHIYSGTPWWGSIILTALLIRLSLMRAYINAADTSARMAVLTPNVEPLKAQMKVAQQNQNKLELGRLTQEVRNLYKAADVKIWKVFVPMLQVPLGFGTFRLLRGMSELPVPGLENGGFLWLKDLTVADPYFILPLMTGLAFHVTFKAGGELGSTALMTPTMKTLFLYGLPLITTTFMLFWPGALQISFAFTSLMALTQSYLLRQPAVRKFLNIQPLRARVDPSTPSYGGVMQKYQAPSVESLPAAPVSRGLVGGAISDIKGAASQVVKSARSLTDSADSKPGQQRRTAEQMKRAKAYEEKREKEIAEAKAEAEQARKAKLRKLHSRR